MAIALFVDEKLISTPESLDQAKQMAEQHIRDKKQVRIECTAWLSAVQSWTYDEKERDWIARLG